MQSTIAACVGVAAIAVYCALIAVFGRAHWTGSTVCLNNDGLGLPVEGDPSVQAPCQQVSNDHPGRPTLLVDGALLPDRGPSWYFWKLAEPTVGTRVLVWCLYLAHLFAVWALLYGAQLERSRAGAEGPRFSTELRPFNVRMLLVNAIFHVLHLAQSHVSYDGLHQDVPPWASQGSVIYVLVLMMTYEARKRGLFVGVPVRRAIPEAVNELIRRYHGYFVAWAAIFTFWCHPCEPVVGFLLGFFHTALFLLQGSLAYTDVHRNPIFRSVVLGWVALHATVISLNTTSSWPQFTSGHILWFGVTVIPMYWLHGRPLWMRLAPAVVVLGLNLAIFATLVVPDKGWAELNAMVRIPLVYWLAPLAFGWLLHGAECATRRFRRSQPRRPMLGAATFLLSMLAAHVVFVLDQVLADENADGPLVPAIYVVCGVATVGVHLGCDCVLGSIIDAHLDAKCEAKEQEGESAGVDPSLANGAKEEGEVQETSS